MNAQAPIATPRASPSFDPRRQPLDGFVPPYIQPQSTGFVPQNNSPRGSFVLANDQISERAVLADLDKMASESASTPPPRFRTSMDQMLDNAQLSQQEHLDILDIFKQDDDQRLDGINNKLNRLLRESDKHRRDKSVILAKMNEYHVSCIACQKSTSALQFGCQREP